jgi:hypothetical protein
LVENSVQISANPYFSVAYNQIEELSVATTKVGLVVESPRFLLSVIRYAYVLGTGGSCFAACARNSAPEGAEEEVYRKAASTLSAGQ